MSLTNLYLYEDFSTATETREANIDDLLRELFIRRIHFIPVGSSMIKGVKVNKDFDILIDGNIDLSKWMDSRYERGGSDVEINGREFVSYRCGLYNFIVSLNNDHYKKFLGAQAICEEKNIVDKGLRIEVFAYIFDDKDKPSMDRFVDIVTGTAKPKEPKW